MKLQVDRGKSGVRHYTKGGLPGFGFCKGAKGGQARVLEEPWRRFGRKLKEMTSRNKPISSDGRISNPYSYITGWIGYYGKARCRAKMKRYDEWLRRRLRMCTRKQWKKVSKRMRSLIQLGIGRQQAYEWANTRKSYWRVSKSPILQRAIATKSLEERGCPSMEKIYLRRHSILMNRRDTRTVRPVV